MAGILDRAASVDMAPRRFGALPSRPTALTALPSWTSCAMSQCQHGSEDAPCASVLVTHDIVEELLQDVDRLLLRLRDRHLAVANARSWQQLCGGMDEVDDRRDREVQRCEWTTPAPRKVQSNKGGVQAFWLVVPGAPTQHSNPFIRHLTTGASDEARSADQHTTLPLSQWTGDIYGMKFEASEE